MLELLGRFGRDFGVAGEGPPDKRAGAPTSSKVIQLAMQSLGPLHLAEVP